MTLTREQQRQVFLGIGRPAPRRRTVLADLMSAVRLVGLRPLMLVVLLGLVILWALTGPAAWGAEAAREPVQKGQGGVAEAADIPLRDRANFLPPDARYPLYNFFHNFPEADGRRTVESPRAKIVREKFPDQPTKLAALLAFLALLILWLHLRSTREVTEISRSPRSSRRSR